jgi:ribosome-associated protein
MIQVTDTIALNDRDVKERFVRAAGPGGQNANQEATAVELRVDIRKLSVPADLKARLTALGGRHVTTEGVLVVVSRAYRSQVQNRDAAHTRLVALLKRAAGVPKKRRATKPAPSARDERRAAKQRQSAIKRARSGRNEDD